MTETKIIASAEAENSGGVYLTELKINQHMLVADEPESVGGKDEGPAPGDLLCMSLASCKAITLRMYAQRKNWPLHSVKVKVDLVKGTELPLGLNTFFCELHFTGELTEEQKTRLMTIAKACPIDKLLTKPSEVVSTLV